MSSLKKIVITGPESSGKTTLAQQLAAHFGAPWVPEYARIYLADLHRPYYQEDLPVIAHEQARQEDIVGEWANRFLFCDTGLEVISIWSMVKYGKVDPEIEQLLSGRSYDLYLLCRPDLAWAADPLRETPDLAERWRLLCDYEKKLKASGVPWKTVYGQGESRLRLAISIIEAQGW